MAALLARLEDTTAPARAADAAATLEHVLDGAPAGHPAAWAALARYQARAGRTDDALASYGRAIGSHPVPTWLASAAELHGGRREWDAAAAHYRRAIEAADGDAPPRWWAELGRVLIRLEDDRGAVRAYRTALDREPDHAGWWHWLGRACSSTGDDLAAVLAHEQAVARGRDQAAGWFHLGRAYERLERWHEAASAYRSADRVHLGTTGGRRYTARLPLRSQLRFSLPERPQYAYIVHKACELARSLGIDRISVIEFGVAGGNGLLALERHAEDIGERAGVAVDVYGLDTGEGLFAPEGVQDVPYYFAAGNYAMDVDALETRLQRASLVLGDAGVTLGALLERPDLAPIGAASFDMDYFSATRDVLRWFGDEAHDGMFLPRAFLYFDDVVGRKMQEYNEFTGELLAIDHFNGSQGETKIAEDRSFRAAPINFEWHHGIYTMHRFGHTRYADYVGRAGATSLGLDR